MGNPAWIDSLASQAGSVNPLAILHTNEQTSSLILDKAPPLAAQRFSLDDVAEMVATTDIFPPAQSDH